MRPPAFKTRHCSASAPWNIDDIAHEETGSDRVKALIREGQRQGVCARPGDAAPVGISALADAHHAQREIGADCLRARRPLQRLEGDVSRARGDIQQLAVGRQRRRLDDETPPFHILAAADDAIEQVVAPGDAIKHRPHIIRAFFAAEMRHLNR